MHRRDLLRASAASVILAALPEALTAATPPEFPWTKKTKSILGHEMAYLDEGAGRPVVFLHGNPTSSFLWRGIIPFVLPGHRAIAPDMIGMGDSEKPGLAYTYADHAAHLHRLLDSFDLTDAVFVLHDWGGALGFDWIMAHLDRVSAVAYMETITPPVMPFPSYEAMGPFGDMFKAWRTPGVGEKMILEENMFIDVVLGEIGVKDKLSPEVLAVYNSYYPDTASRAPLLQWPREVPIGGEPAETTALTKKIAGFLTTSELPKLLFHVTPGAITPPDAVDWMKANVPNLETVHLGPGAHFIQEDYPTEIGNALAAWLTRI